ncbi:hypothetical protein L3Q82_005672 [Scortum barcoo]|uniref:Uncharacterized protein n=1 Tax=Scortum barcoo TaxID=214431 RepID=A0ACB8V615_9TELE|nr:hypothetical protein L3Q82_005672 [Scortum barcoo]
MLPFRLQGQKAQSYASLLMPSVKAIAAVAYLKVESEDGLLDVSFVLDPSMSDLHRTRKILDSLLPPATDVIKHVSPQALPSVYLQLLDSVYGFVEDGDELLAKFMGTLQNNDEKPSDYLNRLQVALSAVVRRGGQTGTKRSTKRPTKTKRVASKCGNANTTSTILPPKLVGTKCTAQVTIEGHKVNCLLDTGSQVTTIPLSFFQTHLPHHSLKPLDGLLDVELQIEGANGEAVPYLGYVELNLMFSEEFLGKETEVPTLVLVVPDVNSVPQILIGTNSLDVLYSNYVERHDSHPQSFNSGYRVVLKILEARQKQASTGSYTPVVVEGQIHMSGAHKEKWAVVEAASMSSLPGGLLVATSLCTLPAKHPCPMSILLRNETQHDITIPPRTVLAEIHAVQQVMGKDPSADLTTPETKRMEFDFGDSPLPPEWKERITRLLSSMPEVFSQHDMDFGHTNKVKHHIKLSDNTPFKHRARPIHPHDVDAVKKHLQELLD